MMVLGVDLGISPAVQGFAASIKKGSRWTAFGQEHEWVMGRLTAAPPLTAECQVEESQRGFVPAAEVA
jgi:hypothetical protein